VGLVDEGDKELRAIKTVIESLQPLDPEGRARVLEYVFKRLAIPLEKLASKSDEPTGRNQGPQPITSGPSSLADVRALKEAKQPRSANQMAALVAYYLSDLAQPNERKEAIGTADITKYFKQASFKLPEKPDATLHNAKNAGYFDSAGEGLYKLNPVGYNLVVHSLPSAGGEKRQAKRKRETKKAGR
jgi:hypothetical protein